MTAACHQYIAWYIFNTQRHQGSRGHQKFSVPRYLFLHPFSPSASKSAQRATNGLLGAFLLKTRQTKPQAHDSFFFKKRITRALGRNVSANGATSCGIGKPKNINKRQLLRLPERKTGAVACLLKTGVIVIPAAGLGVGMSPAQTQK